MACCNRWWCRQIGERFQLVAGERRLRAARSIGLQQVPVRIVDFNDQELVEAALIENIQRSDLNAIEKAYGFKDYLDRFQMTHDQLANRLGLARSTITNLVSILELPPEIQDAIRVGQLNTGHAKLLRGIPDRERQITLSREIISRGMSVHATEAYLKQTAIIGDKPEPAEKPAPATRRKDGPCPGRRGRVRQRLSLKVEIKVRGKEKGQIVLAFESNDDFERLLEVLRR